ncbi:MAG: T9SS type A sorting domain-containing protein [Candidatus Stygibacter australis]|nr:T9SS type A sorting domain-containing protein [Candidatus Stygibacter australis]
MKISIIFSLFCLIFALNLSATIINVPAEQPTIQAGIDISVESDTILVQPGTYVENINFAGKAVILGSLFYTTQDTSYISQTIIDGNQDDNVVTCDSEEDSTSVLTGFTITNGHTGWGGGIYCWESSPSLVNVTITDNLALHRGGGVYCYSSSPSLVNVTITGNSSWEFGGGIYCSYSSSPSLENVTITGNSAGWEGGGIYCYSSSPSLLNVTITNNSAGEYGGGICCSSSSSPSLVNVTIMDNSTEGDGGGIYCTNSSSPSLENVTITGNSAEDDGGGIYCLNFSNPSLVNVTITGNTAGEYGGGIYCRNQVNLSLVNCILWNNSPHEMEFPYINDENIATIAYSDIEGGEEGLETNNNVTVNWCEGNIDADPLFVDAANGNYHLTEDSPCIDAGIAYFEYDGEVLVDLSEDEYFGIAPDMGAYEYEGNAVIYYGDISDNGVVDSYDAALVLMYVVGLDPLPELDPLPWSDWRVERADVNLSGDIGAIDAAYILQYVVGIISELPVVNAMRLSAGEITISHDAEYIYLKSLKGVISFEYELTKSENLTMGLPEVINDDCLYSYNDNKFALISAAGISGNIVMIPYQAESQGAWNVNFQIEDNGNSYDLEYLPEDIPELDRLISIYPNPFNPETNIVFDISTESNVLIEIYNIKGQKVTTLVNDPYKAGSHKVTWNAVGQSSGIYLLRFITAERSEMKKLILLK